MSAYVSDTHSLIWHIFQNRRLSEKARLIFQEIDEGKGSVYIPTVVLVEIVFLLEKARIPQEAIDRVIDLLERPTTNYRIAQIAPATVRALQSLPHHLVPDMPDRIITATALELDLPLITKDRKITEAGVVEVIW